MLSSPFRSYESWYREKVSYSSFVSIAQHYFECAVFGSRLEMFCLLRCRQLQRLFLPTVRIKWSSSSAIDVKQALLTEPEESKHSSLTVKGWVRSVRAHKRNVFFHINDGSSISHLQVIAPLTVVPSNATFGSCIEVIGSLVRSPTSSQQPVEVMAEKITVIGDCNFLDYPFKARKSHSLDYVRQYPHLRPRTMTFGALLRIRSAASKAIHEYFQKEGFCLVHTPILTSNDCEGAGEVFRVEPVEKLQIAVETEDKKRNEDARDHFFGVPTFLTVSGQLHLEVACGAFSKVYTFGPTFRAENARTRHHLSEFYMIEAEISFTQTLEDIIKYIEGMLKFTSTEVLNSCPSDVQFFTKTSPVLKHLDILEKFVTKPFLRMTYSEAIEILTQSADSFENKVTWGIDLHKEHEQYLVRHCDNLPVFVTDYPTDIKPFYAKLNEDSRTVAAVDLLAPGVGEICGGSLRENCLDILQQRINQESLNDNLNWYLDLRRFGSAPHGGFGIGFERYLQVFLGISNIKDAIIFPRSSNNCRL